LEMSGACRALAERSWQPDDKGFLTYFHDTGLHGPVQRRCLAYPGSVKTAVDIPFDLAKHPQEDLDIARF
jgi:hypothetical protein